MIPPIQLPVGFESFHKKRFVNYQLNRAHSLGYARRDELADAAARVRGAGDCARVLDDLSACARHDGRPANAASYLRIAEFFTPGRSPEKVARYRRYRDLFDEATDHVGLERHEVPYPGGSLPAYRLPAQGPERLGSVLVHGGFDSLIEEFFAIWHRIAHAGFDVVAFDGPGQGGARRLSGITFDHDWEKPVGAVLDYFDLEVASLVGISMGGYWSLRAAGREPRIDRVVSWPPVFDWLLRVPSVIRPLAEGMLDRRRFMRLSVRARARLVPTLGLVVDQTLYNLDSTDHYDVVSWFLEMNPEHLASSRVTQDVLVLAGENDRFQPPKLAAAQVAALTNARSVSVRTFTEQEHADEHCQMGNLALACQVVTDWLAAPRSPARP